MPRKPIAFSQLKLRLKLAERRELEIAAEHNGTTLNGEIGARIRQREMLDTWRLAQDVRRCLGPLVDNAHELAKSGDLIRATDEIVALVQAGEPTGAAMEAAIARYGRVKRMIEIEAGIRLRQMHTTGEQL